MICTTCIMMRTTCIMICTTCIAVLCKVLVSSVQYLYNDMYYMYNDAYYMYNDMYYMYSCIVQSTGEFSAVLARLWQQILFKCPKRFVPDVICRNCNCILYTSWVFVETGPIIFKRLVSFSVVVLLPLCTEPSHAVYL